MKKRALGVIAMLALWFALSGTGHADPYAKINVNIPFDFFVGKAKLSAGRYTVERPIQDVLWISSIDGRSSVITLTTDGRSGKMPSKAMLVFHQYGEMYFLSQFWEESSSVPYQLPKSHAEHRLEKRAKLLARNRSAVQVIYIYAE
jgi:hypothetical protein